MIRPSGCSPPLVRADSQRLLIRIFVWRHDQVQRRGRALEHPAGEIEARAVAGTEKATRPGGTHLGAGRLEALLRKATQMRAGTDENEVFRFARAQGVLCVRRL